MTKAPPYIEAIIRPARLEWGIEEGDLTRAGGEHGASLARATAALLAKDLGAGTLTDLAKRFGRDVSTLSGTIRRPRVRLQNDVGLVERIEAIRAKCLAKEAKKQA